MVFYITPLILKFYECINNTKSEFYIILYTDDIGSVTQFKSQLGAL